MPPTVQQPAAPQPVQQAVVPPVPPVAEPPAAQQPEADTEKCVAEQPAAVPPEPVAKAESIPPAAQKEVEPVAQWVNPRYADHSGPKRTAFLAVLYFFLFPFLAWLSQISVCVKNERK